VSETLFVSDVHLSNEHPAQVRLFERLLLDARSADALYILGDLFEYWVGDDDPAEGLTGVIAGLGELSRQGVPVYFIHGNRDFLIGRGFSKRTGVELLPEAVVVDLYGTPTLLMHGDTLCTDDRAYLAFRKKARNPIYQRLFLWKSLAKRRAIAQGLRAKSEQEVKAKTAEIMDVNVYAVSDAMRKYKVRRLIHGHTHRRAIHNFDLSGDKAQRVVLGDWYETGSVLRVSPTGITLEEYQ
jgi:UDP-2,3-diacylglucosamine hydrolase